MENILICRTDNLGDVVLTFPLTAYLKKIYPKSRIIFLGKKYTAELIKACNSIDEFISKEDLLNNPNQLSKKKIDVTLFIYPDKDVAKICKQQNIPIRIGTSHRIFHWLYANKLVSFSRKKSDLHEAQLNFKLLKGLGINLIPDIETLGNLLDLTAKADIPASIQEELSLPKKKVILHPKSKGSAREWPIASYFSLAANLLEAGYSPIITGTKDEGDRIRNEKNDFFSLPGLVDFTGRLTLGELISVIDKSDGLIACSTGPLHIASALGKNTIGFYPSVRPMHAGRWKPIGKKSTVLTLKENCSDCVQTTKCNCIEAISSIQVLELIKGWK